MAYPTITASTHHLAMMYATALAKREGVDIANHEAYEIAAKAGRWFMRYPIKNDSDVGAKIKDLVRQYLYNCRQCGRENAFTKHKSCDGCGAPR